MSAKPVVGRVTTDGPFWLSNSDFSQFPNLLSEIPLIFQLLTLVSLPVCISLKRRRQWHPTPVLLPGKSHGWRSLVGCSSWDRKESDMTERLHFHFSLLCIGEGNGNPLQCSCLENPRDGVTQSRTRLK